jgi:hypothetical protein
VKIALVRRRDQARSGAGFGKMRFCAGGGGTMITGYGLDMNWAFAGAFSPCRENPNPCVNQP